MEKLRRKLKDSRGATIILALLFLLLCMMVAATLLMAAVSNAGKAQRSRVEQQKHLTLSSALDLVRVELEAAEYRGRYSYGKETVLDIGAVAGPDGQYKPEDYHDKHTYTQRPGELATSLNALKPLSAEMDILFARVFSLGSEQFKDEYVYDRIPVPAEGDIPKAPYELTLEVTLDDAGKESYPGLGEKVTITAEVRPTGVIHLTAALGEEENGYQYKMEAELEPVKKPRDVLALAETPAGETHDNDGNYDYYQTEPLKWKLGWVSKQEEVAAP